MYVCTTMVRVPRAYAVNKQYLASSTSAQPSSDCLIRRPGDDPPESEQCLLFALASASESARQSRIAAMPSMSHLKKKKAKAGQTVSRVSPVPSVPSPPSQSQSIPQAHEQTVTRPIILTWGGQGRAGRDRRLPIPLYIYMPSIKCCGSSQQWHDLIDGWLAG